MSSNVTNGGGYRFDNKMEVINSETNMSRWLMRFDTTALANDWTPQMQSNLISAYIDDSLLDAYSRSEIFKIAPSETQLSQIKTWLLKQKTY